MFSVTLNKVFCRKVSPWGVDSLITGAMKKVSTFSCPQYYSDANDAESWLKEKMPVVCSEDYGRDEQSATVSDERSSSSAFFLRRGNLAPLGCICLQKRPYCPVRWQPYCFATLSDINNMLCSVMRYTRSAQCYTRSVSLLFYRNSRYTAVTRSFICVMYIGLKKL